MYEIENTQSRILTKYVAKERMAAQMLLKSNGLMPLCQNVIQVKAAQNQFCNPTKNQGENWQKLLTVAVKGLVWLTLTKVYFCNRKSFLL